MKLFNKLNSSNIKDNTINLIVTRFNIPSTFSNKIELKSYNKEWLEERKSIFKNFTYPSIMKQKYDDFYWIVLFGSETDDDYIKSLGDKIYPIKAASLKEGVTILKEELTNKLKDKKYKFSVTRLDNDDALLDVYMNVVHNFGKMDIYNYFNNQFALNFRTGLEIDANYEFYRRDFPNNSFSTIFEYTQSDKISIVYSSDHNDLSKKYYTFSLTSEDLPFWTMNVHGDNVGNEIKGKRLSIKQLLGLRNYYLPFKIIDSLKNKL